MPQHIAILNEQNIYYEGQQYHIKKGNINRSHVNAMIIDAEDAMEQPAGVSLSIMEGTLTPGSATVVFTNTSDIDYLFGEGYTLEQEINGVWSYLPISDFLTFNGIAYILNAMESSEKEENWLYPYGQLSPGSYRIAKNIFPRGTQTPQTMYLFAAFTIDDSK